MVSIEEQARIQRIVNANANLRAIAKRLKVLSRDPSVDINKVIMSMKLPLKYHMFITANYSTLMSLNYKEDTRR